MKKSAYLNGRIFSDAKLSEDFVLRAFWRDVRNERITMPSGKVPSLSKMLESVVESRPQISSESEGTRKWFLMIMSYCWNASEARDVSAVWQSAARKQLCVRGHSTKEVRR